jgi:hypothetical protein
MFAAIWTIITIISTAIKLFPRIRAILAIIFGVASGRWTAKSGLIGILLFLFTFIGGMGFIVSIYMGFGLELYLRFFDFLFTPFAYLAESFISSFVSQLPSLPANTASFICLFDFSRCFTLLVTGFSFEVYLRVVIYFLIRRGK